MESFTTTVQSSDRIAKGDKAYAGVCQTVMNPDGICDIKQWMLGKKGMFARQEQTTKKSLPSQYIFYTCLKDDENHVFLVVQERVDTLNVGWVCTLI